MPLDANQIKETISEKCLSKWGFPSGSNVPQTVIFRMKWFYEKEKVLRRNPICRQFFGDPIECDAGAVRFFLFFAFREFWQISESFPRIKYLQKNLTQLICCWFNLTGHWIGKRWGWTRCPGLVLLDVFNVEYTKVIAYTSSSNKVCTQGALSKYLN